MDAFTNFKSKITKVSNPDEYTEGFIDGLERGATEAIIKIKDCLAEGLGGLDSFPEELEKKSRVYIEVACDLTGDDPEKMARDMMSR